MTAWYGPIMNDNFFYPKTLIVGLGALGYGG